MSNIVYYSSMTGNTEAFVNKLNNVKTKIKIPLKMDSLITINCPFIFFIPTYAANDGRGALPKSVIKFLNHETNRSFLKGVVASGNTNFGKNYCLGGDIVSKKCNVPVIHRYELRGNELDVNIINNYLKG